MDLHWPAWCYYIWSHFLHTQKPLHMPLTDVLHQMHANHEALAVFQVSAFHTVNLPLKGYSTIYTFSQTNMAWNSWQAHLVVVIVFWEAKNRSNENSTQTSLHKSWCLDISKLLQNFSKRNACLGKVCVTSHLGRLGCWSLRIRAVYRICIGLRGLCPNLKLRQVQVGKCGWKLHHIFTYFKPLKMNGWNLKITNYYNWKGQIFEPSTSMTLGSSR